MTLPLTPHMLEAAYEYLRTTPPFSGWRLPHADAVEFHVIRTPAVCGWHIAGETPTIAISTGRIGWTQALMETMAHEMIHLFQARRRSETPRTEHNAEFVRLAARVCDYHGFDPKLFI